MRDNISIEIHYKRLNDTSWNKIILPPDIYFDLDEDEKAEVDSVPDYSNPLNYIDRETNDIINIKILINDFKNNAWRTISYTYWNDQKSFIAERIDYINKTTKTEIIISADIQQDPRITDIIRAIRKDGMLFPIYHGVIKDNPDVSQQEIQHKIH